MLTITIIIKDEQHPTIPGFHTTLTEIKVDPQGSDPDFDSRVTEDEMKIGAAYMQVLRECAEAQQIWVSLKTARAHAEHAEQVKAQRRN